MTHEPERTVNRYYDPTTDEFLSIDPDVATTDQPYVFANDDTLNAEDPLGLFCIGLCTFTNAAESAGHSAEHLADNARTEVVSHWRGLAQIGTVVVSLASCSTVVLCALGGAAAGAAFYSEGSAGTSNFSWDGLGISTAVGGGFGGIGGYGSQLATEGADQIAEIMGRSTLTKVLHPVGTVTSLAKGAARIVAGKSIKVSSVFGGLVCDAKKC